MSKNSPAFHDKYRDIMVITWETDVVPRDLIWEDKQEGTSQNNLLVVVVVVFPHTAQWGLEYDKKCT